MGLAIAAAIATLLAIALIGGAALWSARPMDRPVLVAAFLFMLPVQPLVFYAVRMPLIGVLSPLIGAESWWPFAATWAAPLTEEPAKWLVLLLPALRRQNADSAGPAHVHTHQRGRSATRGLVPANAIPLALAVGLGFGIGEIWFVAHAFISGPNYPDLPF